MEFSEQIKSIRQEQGLTQEQLANRLNVSRQAVSNWENDRNLPDIEMLIAIAGEFHISLDRLILGDDNVNNMTQKLINDGSENKRAKMNLISVIIGAAMLFACAALVAIKAASPEYVDADGVLHESFFLLPIAAAFFFGGFVTFAVTGIRGIVALIGNRAQADRKKLIVSTVISLLAVALCCALFILLKMANS